MTIPFQGYFLLNPVRTISTLDVYSVLILSAWVIQQTVSVILFRYFNVSLYPYDKSSVSVILELFACD